METKNEDFELTLFDRLETIRTAYEKYDLERKAYLSFSGGKDSTVLHYLLDEAVPNNRIPRVYISTGIEYNDVVKHVKEMAENDDRIEIITPKIPIRKVLETYGYPFKSKEHSMKLYLYKNGSKSKSVTDYLTKDKFACPKKLKYQFSDDFNIKISPYCCHKLKKEPAKKWAKEHAREILMTGMRKSEGGERTNLTCILTDKSGRVIKFHPLAVVSNEFEEWYIRTRNIKLASLYYPPFNFVRTGCKGCPFSLDIQKQLDVMEKYLPNEKKQCEVIWKPVYEEYRRLNYRLRRNQQLSLFDDDD